MLHVIQKIIYGLSCRIRFPRLHRKYRDVTMVDLPYFCTNLRLAESILSIPGCVVECGVWKGGMSAALADLLGPDRTYYLCDSFEGLPPAKAIDGEEALAWEKATDVEAYHNNLAASMDIVRASMQRSSARKFELIKGWFNESLPTFTPAEPIALLRLDGDWYESTMPCLEYLYPKVVSGGYIIIDDYYTWEGCTRAVHDYLSRQQLSVRIHEVKGVAYLIKP